MIRRSLCTASMLVALAALLLPATAVEAGRRGHQAGHRKSTPACDVRSGHHRGRIHGRVHFGLRHSSFRHSPRHGRIHYSPYRSSFRRITHGSALHGGTICKPRHRVHRHKIRRVHRPRVYYRGLRDCSPRTYRPARYRSTSLSYAPSYSYLPPPTRVEVVHSNSAPPDPLPEGDPWAMLASGDLTSARILFGTQAAVLKDRALPKLGFAIAVAMQGDDELAIWSMRRALRTGAGALDEANVVHLRDALSVLAGRYQAMAGEPGAARDALFMTAVFRYLLGDEEAAAAALAGAREAGDDSVSAAALEELLSARTSSAESSHPGYAVTRTDNYIEIKPVW